MKITGKDPETLYKSYLISKATKALMKSIDHTETTLDLLYIDHWGPSPITSLLGNTHFFLI